MSEIDSQPKQSHIWCFDAGMLGEALEALYQSRQPDDAEAREAAAEEMEQIRRFLNSDIAREYKLIVKISKRRPPAEET